MKRILTALAVAASFFTGFSGAAQAETEAFAMNTKTHEIYGVRIGNPLDVGSWWRAHPEMSGDMEPMAINPADPDFWMAFIDPKRHGHAHMTFLNPAMMAQFMQVETYTAMMDVDVWAKWLELDSYAPMLDVQTYAYWMQPGAYAHMLDIGQIEPMLDLGNYRIVAHSAFETMGVAEWVEANAAKIGLH